MKEKKYIAVEDCVVNHKNEICIFKKGDEVKDKEIIDILIPQGLVREVLVKKEKIEEVS